MNTPNSEYQVIYGVSLLDDLHNYFPDLLYNQQRFHSIQNVFYYVRQQLHSRFNLYSYGARQAQQTQQTQPQQRPIRPTPFTPFTPPFTPTTPMVPPTTRRQTEDEIIGNLNAANLLLAFLGTGTGTGAGWGQPVVVRPTAAVLEANTTLVSGTPGQRCAICQDEMRAEESCRRLNACTHLFHRSCIDQWFERSVRCPQCRHDIREPTLAANPS